jgi:alpha-tubulin suppressor-like RCC1 family protein
VSSVQCRGVGIFGALGLGDLDDAHDFRIIPNASFERMKTPSNMAPKRGKRSENEKSDEVSYPVAAEAGFGHSVVLTNDGKLFLFGRAFDINSVVRIYGVYKYSSYFARLATKLTIEADRDHKIEVLKKPFFIPGMDRYNFTKVACSGGLTAALSSTGQIFCFGVNRFGQCGTGELGERYWFPSVNVGVPKALDVDVGLQHAICLCVGVSECVSE